MLTQSIAPMSECENRIKEKQIFRKDRTPKCYMPSMLNRLNLTPDASLSAEARGGLAPNTVTAAPASRCRHGGGGTLGLTASRRSTDGSSADGCNCSILLSRLGTRRKIARGRSASGARVAGAALSTDGVVKDLVVGPNRCLGASRALGTRARIVLQAGRVGSRAGGASVAGRRATDAVECKRRRTPEAGRAARARCTLANVAILIDIASLVGKWAFAIQGATLAGNELAGLLFSHVLVAIVAVVVAMIVGVGSVVGIVGVATCKWCVAQSSYVKNGQHTVNTSKISH